MAKPVIALRQRRSAALILTLLASLALCVSMIVGSMARLPIALYSGILLYALMLLLTAFNARKKVPFIPLLSASTWLQIHIYVGLFSLILFAFHIGFTWPRGTIEVWLAAVFILVCLSGFFGLFISRWLPKRMQLSGEAITYEKMPALKRELIKTVETCVSEVERETRSSSISDFYLQKLQPFFDRQPGLFHAFAPEGNFLKLFQETEDLNRYLDAAELPYQERIRECLRKKRHLDFMQSANRLLRVWLFIHIPFTYSLLILGLVHGVLALLYGGAH